jgi:hypothetical protein
LGPDHELLIGQTAGELRLHRPAGRAQAGRLALEPLGDGWRRHVRFRVQQLEGSLESSGQGGGDARGGLRGRAEVGAAEDGRGGRGSCGARSVWGGWIHLARILTRGARVAALGLPKSARILPRIADCDCGAGRVR